MASGRKPLYERTSSLSFSLRNCNGQQDGAGLGNNLASSPYSPFISANNSDITKKMFEYDRLALDVAEQFAPKTLHSPRSKSFFEAASPNSGFEDGSNRRLSGGSSSNDMFDCASSGYGSPGLVGTPLASPAPNSLQYISNHLQKMFIDQGFSEDISATQNLLNNLNGLNGKNGFDPLAKDGNGIINGGANLLANGTNGFEASLMKSLENPLVPCSPIGINTVQSSMVDNMQILASIPPPNMGISPANILPTINNGISDQGLDKIFAARPIESRRFSESSQTTPKPIFHSQTSITPTLPMQIISPEATPRATPPPAAAKPPPAANDGFETDEIQEFASLLCSPKKAPPPRYQCHICYQNGHYISDCPMRFNSPYEELTPYQGRKKCYGEFQCQQCKRKWTSQNSVANEAQSCIKCHVPVFPHKQLPIDKAVALGLVKAQKAIPTKIAPIGHGRPPLTTNHT
jgi:hypothetical protein